MTIQSIRQLLDKLSGGRNTPQISHTLPPWKKQLHRVAVVAERVLDSINKPKTKNDEVVRYLLMDLLDTLSAQGIVERSPFSEYSDRVGTFEDQFYISWKTLGSTVFLDDRDTQRSVYSWGKTVHKNRAILPHSGSLNWGIRILQAQPPVIIGANPVGWEMALPRLMAQLIDENIWQSIQIPVLLREFHQILLDFYLVDLPPSEAMSVQWKRMRHNGLSHLACLATSPEVVGYPDVMRARFIWMQTCVYYALIRGKLHRIGLDLDPSDSAELDEALEKLLSYFTSEALR